MNYNTVALLQALLYIILDQSSLCSKCQRVSWWIPHTHTQVSGPSLGKDQEISFIWAHIYETINIPCSTKRDGYPCLLQVHPEVHHTSQDPSGEPEWSFHHPLLQVPLSCTIDKKWKRLTSAWFWYIVRVQARHALNFWRHSIGLPFSDTDVAWQSSC